MHRDLTIIAPHQCVFIAQRNVTENSGDCYQYRSHEFSDSKHVPPSERCHKSQLREGPFTNAPVLQEMSISVRHPVGNYSHQSNLNGDANVRTNIAVRPLPMRFKSSISLYMSLQVNAYSSEISSVLRFHVNFRNLCIVTDFWGKYI